MANKKILLIEDDPVTLELYISIFKNTDYELEISVTGDDALKKLQLIKERKIAKPDLVLLDLVLPGVNGMTILAEIRNNEKIKDLPVFILTNYIDKETLEESQRLKAEKYIVKTQITPPMLLKIVKEWLVN